MPLNQETLNPTQAFEAGLLHKLIQGDKESFNQIVDAYFDSMLRLARSIVGESIAEEVVQESWLSVYAALPNFEGRSTLKTWILRITANEAKSRLRRESRQVSINAFTGGATGFLAEHFQDDGHWSTPPTLWHDASPEALLASHQLSDCIRQRLEKLPTLQRAVFTLKELEDHSFDDICNILDISASNVRVLLHRARIGLYSMIEHFQASGEC